MSLGGQGQTCPPHPHPHPAPAHADSRAHTGTGWGPVRPPGPLRWETPVGRPHETRVGRGTVTGHARATPARWPRPREGSGACGSCGPGTHSPHCAWSVGGRDTGEGSRPGEGVRAARGLGGRRHRLGPPSRFTRVGRDRCLPRDGGPSGDLSMPGARGRAQGPRAATRSPSAPRPQVRPRRLGALPSPARQLE